VLYGVIEAFRDGRLPTNVQIDKTLRYILDHSPVDVHKLSPEGRKFVQNAKDIIETARLMVHQKNADELLQNFIWHTRTVDSQKLKTNGLSDAVPIESLKSDADKGITTVPGLSYHLLNFSVRRTAPSHPPFHYSHQLGSPKTTLRYLSHRCRYPLQRSYSSCTEDWPN
jgi:hypothetical protein